MAGPNQGEVYDGYRFMGGDPSDQGNWQQVAPVDVSSEYGAGARQLPNGTIERVGPRGGVTKIADAVGQDSVAKLTEGQGKSLLYGNMMAGAERDYQKARSEGYNPASLRNQVASAAGIIPFDGDFFGRLIRDDVSDRGRQAELRWAEGNLRQLTGAAATNPEIARVAAINFDRGNDQLSDQRYRTRAETYQGTRYAAGPGAKVLDDYPLMSGAVGDLTERGLPSYPTISAMTADVDEIPAPDGGYGPRPDVPGGSPETAIDYTSVPPDQLVTLLANGGWVRQGDGEPYQVAPGSVRRASADEGDVEVARGVYQRPTDTPDGAVEQRRAMNPLLRRIDAAGRGAADVLSLETADEIAGFADAAIGRGQGRTFGERARNNIAVQRAVDEADGQDVPWSRRAGQAAGIVAALPRVVASGVRNAPRFVRLARTAGEGAAVGAASGFGSAEGNAVERVPNALGGAAIGAVAAPVANALGGRVIDAAQAGGRLLSRNVGRGMTALGVPGGQELVERATPNALTTGIARMNERVRANPEAMRVRAEELAAQGIEPTAADLVDDAGRGTLRALATRQTPARTAAREFAENRAIGLQDRVSAQARRTISDDPRQPRELREEFVSRGRENAAPLYNEAYGRPGAPRSPLIDELMQRPSMREALGRANRIAREEGRDPTTLGFDFDEAGNVLHVREPSMQTMDYIKRGLDDYLESFRDPVSGRLNLDTAGRAAQGTRTAFRNELRRLNPSYGRALDAYADEAQMMEAVDIGERFLSMDAADFATAIARLSTEQRQVARAAARRAVERAAGTPGQAPGVAQRLSGGREQGARNAALVDDPAAMETAMRAERDMLMNARAVSPAQGSATNINQQDALAAAGEAVGAVRDVATGNIPGLLGRAVQRIRSRGFSDAEAEEIVMAAIDPARTREVIDRLAEAGVPRQEARTSVRAIRRAATQHAAASSQTPK